MYIHNIKYKLLILIFLLIIFIAISMFSYVYAVSQNISNSVFRLHVIANSNSYEDQNLKYKIRDKILEFIPKNITCKKDTEKFITENLSIIEDLIEEELYRSGYNYTVELEIGNSFFPTKDYKSISLPAGYYDGLKVKIGSASGENWWCVMFPPLCFVDISTGIVPSESQEILKEDLSSEEYDLISKSNNDELSFKFKLIEVFQNINLQLAKGK